MRWLPLLIAASLIAAGCSGDDGSADPDPAALAEELAAAAELSRATSTTTTLRPPVPTDPPERDVPFIGDLEIPCRPADAVELPARAGITDETITIGTGSDRGGLATAGAGVGVIEMIGALADFCNAHGGILGRDVLVVDYDAAGVEAVGRVEQACEETAALVGHAFLQLFDSEIAAATCGLGTYPNGQGLMTPDPVPLHGVLSAVFLAPETAASVALVGPDTTTAAVNRARRQVAIEQGAPILSVVADLAYPIDVLPDWERIVGDARALGAGQVHIDGSCAQAVIPFMEVAAAAGWQPVIVATATAYDADCLMVPNPELLLVELPFLPLEDGDDAPATQAHADLVASLGVVPTGAGILAASSFWRWATNADLCLQSDDVNCARDTAESDAEWTAGGLHPAVSRSGDGEGCAIVMGVGADGFDRRLPTEPGTYDCAPERSIAVDLALSLAAAEAAELLATGTTG